MHLCIYSCYNRRILRCTPIKLLVLCIVSGKLCKPHNLRQFNHVFKPRQGCARDASGARVRLTANANWPLLMMRCRAYALDFSPTPAPTGCTLTIYEFPPVETDCTFYQEKITSTAYTECHGCALKTIELGIGLVSLLALHASFCPGELRSHVLRRRF